MDLLVSAHQFGPALPSAQALITAHRILTTFAIAVVISSSIRSHKRGDGWKGQLV